MEAEDHKQLMTMDDGRRQELFREPTYFNAGGRVKKDSNLTHFQAGGKKTKKSRLICIVFHVIQSFEGNTKGD